MNRRDFLSKVTTATAVLGVASISVLDANAQHIPKPCLPEIDTATLTISDDIRSQFRDIAKWLKQNGWTKYLTDLTGLDLDTEDPYNLLLFKYLDKKVTDTGFDDFGGCRVIEPGAPELSLLYHALASPRVKPKRGDESLVKAYPTFEELDKLENYIYSLRKINEQDTKGGNFFLAVLAYEYRPAFKVPPFNIGSKFRKHADFVYSRTGVARVGDRTLNYDAENRCYTNLPKGNDEKHIAVTPARYGLFLVELVQLKSFISPTVTLMNREENDAERYFIRPVTKICKDGKNINFSFVEYHLNEKLYRISQFKVDEKDGKPITLSGAFNVQLPPFRIVNSTDDKGTELPLHKTAGVNLVNLSSLGSSALLASRPDTLVRPAVQGDKKIGFIVPAGEPGLRSNRRYTSYKFIPANSKDVLDLIITDGVLRRSRKTTRFGTPRNAPMFANIRNKMSDGNDEEYLGANTQGFESEIYKGLYVARLFEDNICDGCITVQLSSNLTWLYKLEILPAFSIVTAPDFFPYVDGNDINFYFKHKGYAPDEHFFEGGTINLSGIRLKGNADIINPVTRRQAFSIGDISYNTITAVLSRNTRKKENATSAFNVTLDRDYKHASYLPDTTSGIFYPGWDATFSNTFYKNERFFATFGLGSPFPEDMKLCAAANGMWPVASPDAGRTFQGSLEKVRGLNRKPSTSIPLMDDEIGLHRKAPHIAHGKDPSLGWDGEEGPFLWVRPDKKAVVNFTDIGRADYVANALNPAIGFNMTDLRKLEVRQLIDRMECLRKCIRAIDKILIGKRQVGFTKMWLISAEEVNWSGEVGAYGIPDNLIGTNNNWAKSNPGLSGNGYLFVFADTIEDKLDRELEATTSKRRNQVCKDVYVCKVTTQKLFWCKLSEQFPKPANYKINWKEA